MFAWSYLYWIICPGTCWPRPSCACISPNEELLVYTLIPRCRGGKGERASGTHCLFMRLIATEFCSNCVRTYTGDVINSLRWCASWCSVHVNFISGSWIPQDKAEDKNTLPLMSVFTEETCPYAVIHNFLSQFLYHGLPDISLCTQHCRACSSDVYSVLRSRAEINFTTVYAITWTVDLHTSTHPLLCHVIFAIITRMHKQCVPGVPLLCAWERG